MSEQEFNEKHPAKDAEAGGVVEESEQGDSSAIENRKLERRVLWKLDTRCVAI
jgi:hypothetical protein